MRNIYAFILLALLCSCSKDRPPEIIRLEPAVSSYKSVLILGNSLAIAATDPSIGWNGDWGMAASKPELDYVHILTKKLRTINSNCLVKVKNIGAFEVAYTSYDYREDYKALRDSHPDLIIIQIGENIKQDSPLLPRFEEEYNKLIDYLKQNNPNVKILAVGSFWGNPVVDQVMQKRSKYVTLRPLLNDPSNQAFGEYEDYGVQVHPSDKGMLQIAEIVWQGLIGL
jgi:lysophospholipase L1-like esterase